MGSDTQIFAEVAFNGPGQLELSTFTYSVPEHLRTAIGPGYLVRVPFRQSRLPGIVISLHDNPPSFSVREIEDMFALRPVVFPHAIQLAHWMSHKYLAPIPTVLRLFLPAGRRLRVVEAYTARTDTDPSPLPTTEAKLLEVLKTKGPLTPKGLASTVSESTVRRHLRTLMAKGLVEKIIVPDMAEDLLRESHHIRMRSTGVDVDSAGGSHGDGQSPPALSPRVQEAWERLQRSLERGSNAAVALYGLSFPERLSLYPRLFRSLARQHRGGLLLLPEISAAEEVLRILVDSMGTSVAVLHSRLGTARLQKEWLKLWSGEANIAVGARIAVFAPVQNLSLIVVDEETDDSYKSPQNVSYSARDVALKLSQLCGANIVFCGSVPSMWLHAAAKRGDVSILPTPLVGLQETPSVEVVDLRRSSGSTPSLLTQRLLQSLNDTVAAGQQAVVILNRRGLASSVVCRKCGARVSCPRCEGPMTFHQQTNQLTCHRCGYHQGIPQFCEVCGARDFRFLGVGTERVAKDLQRLLPGTRILRFDRDSAPNSTTQRMLIRSFAKGEWHILVGTSLALEAVEAPAVTLVAVLIPEVALHLPDIDAAERVFQMIFRFSLWQRLRRNAHFIVETYSPDHHAIRCGVKADPSCFYSFEAPLRKARGYPPFGEFIRLLYTSTSEATCQRQGRAMFELLQALASERQLAVDILGPGPAYWRKLAGKHRWHILVKGPDALELVRQADIHRGWHIDVDPVTIL